MQFRFENTHISLWHFEFSFKKSEEVKRYSGRNAGHLGILHVALAYKIAVLTLEKLENVCLVQYSDLTIKIILKIENYNFPRFYRTQNPERKISEKSAFSKPASTSCGQKDINSGAQLCYCLTFRPTDLRYD